MSLPFRLSNHSNDDSIAIRFYIKIEAKECKSYVRVWSRRIDIWNGWNTLVRVMGVNAGRLFVQFRSRLLVLERLTMLWLWWGRLTARVFILERLGVRLTETPIIIIYISYYSRYYGPCVTLVQKILVFEVILRLLDHNSLIRETVTTRNILIYRLTNLPYIS